MTGLARVTALAIGAALLGGAPSSPAWSAAPPAADPTDTAERKGEEARNAYRAGNYDQAIALYFEANDIAASAGFLFNIAFIYDRKLRDPDLGLQYYRRVVTASGAEPEVVAKARARIAELEARGVGGGVRDPGSGAGDEGGTDNTAGDGSGSGQGGATKNRDSAGGGDGSNAGGTGPGVVEPAAPGSRDLVPALLMAGGGALLATGLVFAGVAGGTASDFEAARDPASRSELQSQGQGEALTADLLMFGGLAVAGTGLVLWLLDDGGQGQQSVHIAPAPLEGGVGVAIGGRL